ncbi:hypothetical protein AAVH_16304, partial [Aphelenchoides avenae]
MAKQVRPSMHPDYADDIYGCLDRFSLDSVGFTCPTLKGIVDKHLPEEPLRVLESVTIEWRNLMTIVNGVHVDAHSVTATLVPESPLGKTMTVENDVDGADRDMNCQRRMAFLHYTAALCANSFVKFFKTDGLDWRTFLHVFREHLRGIRVQRLMALDNVSGDAPEFERRIALHTRGVESVLMKTPKADVGAWSLQWLKELGVRRLAVNNASNLVTEDGVRAFCISGPETVDEAAPNRSMYLRAANLSFEFLQQLAQECLATDAGRMPTITFYNYEPFVPPLPEHLAQARHLKDGRRCLHFRFVAAAGPYEIVAQSRGGQQWKVMLRGGHSAAIMNDQEERPSLALYWGGHFKLVVVGGIKAVFDAPGRLYYDPRSQRLQLFDENGQIRLNVPMHRVRQPRSDRFPKGGQYNIQLTHPAKDGSNVDCELQFRNPDEAARLNLHKFIIAERGVELPGAIRPGNPRDNLMPAMQKKKKTKAKRSKRQKDTELETEKALRKQAEQKISRLQQENAKKDQAIVSLTMELLEERKGQQISRASDEKLSTMAKSVRPSLSEQPDYAIDIFECLDRFSLDSVGFTCPTLRGIVDKHMPEEPLRVLESVAIEWDDGLIAKLVPESPLGQTMTIYYGKKMLRRTAALCANSFVKFFKIGEGGDWRAILHTFGDYLPGIRIGKLMTVHYKFELMQRIVQLTRGVESLLMTAHKADVGVESMVWLKEHGIRRLAVYGAYRLTEDAVLAFCIGGPETADEAAPNRSMYLCGTDLSFEFLQQLAQ